MLSYMVPIDEKPPPIPGNKGILALELLDQGTPEVPPRRAKTISKESSASSFASDLTLSSSTPTGGAHDKPRHKLLANGVKHPPLKRVSFGSSKGSMVETLIYESPLQEVPESSPAVPAQAQDTTFTFTLPAEDESERSKVRVSFFQGARPQCVSPPAHEPPPAYCPAVADMAMADHAAYNRQVSTESGWDNPFRPDGDLSREADEIVSLIKGGKPITPTPLGAPLIADEIDNVAHNVSAIESSPQTKAASPKAMNGTKNGGAVPERPGPGPVTVQRQPPAEPQQAEHVTIKRKSKCKCCVIQ